jgi:cell division protein FtsL
MTRLNVLLLLALIGSSLYLVRVSYDARRLFAELDRARSEERRLEVEFEKLKTEKQSQGTSLRVERTARERLAMQNANPTVTAYVTYAPAASAAGRAP